MKRFRFTLSALLLVREKEETERKNALARALGEYNRESELREACLRKRRDNAEKADLLSPDDLVATYPIIEMTNKALLEEARMHAAIMKSMEAEIAARREALARAMKNRKVVELEKERQLKEYKRYREREEQKALDEWRAKETLLDGASRTPESESVGAADENESLTRHERLIARLQAQLS